MRNMSNISETGHVVLSLALLAQKPVVSAALIVGIVLTFCANVLVILTISLNKNLHNIHNIYFISSSLCGLLLCIDFSLEFVQVLLDFSWPFNVGICVFWEILDLSICSVVLLTFTLISFNRFMSIKSPFKAWASQDVQKILILLIWIFPISLWALINVTLMLEKSPPDNDCFITYSHYLCYGLILLTCFVPLCLGLLLNAMSIRELKSLRRTSVRQRRPSTTLSKDQKAIFTLLALELTTIVCWLPYIVILPLVRACGA